MCGRAKWRLLERCSLTSMGPRKSKVLGKGSEERGQSQSVLRHLFLYFRNMHSAKWPCRHQDGADVASHGFPQSAVLQLCHQAGAIARAGSTLSACSPQLLQK